MPQTNYQIPKAKTTAFTHKDSSSVERLIDYGPSEHEGLNTTLKEASSDNETLQQ